MRHGSDSGSQSNVIHDYRIIASITPLQLCLSKASDKVDLLLRGEWHIYLYFFGKCLRSTDSCS